MERPYQRPVPGPREVRTPHHPGGAGADAAGARAHTHAKGTRGLPQGQPDRARGTHRPRGMAYQQARIRDTRTGRPATRSAGHAGREGGNGRGTTPGTGPSPPNRPRAPRTHRRGTATAKAVVAHCATPCCNNLEMYWCLSKNDKKVTDFRKEMECVEDAKQAFLIAHESLHSNLQSASLCALCETQHKEQQCISTLLHRFGFARSFLHKLV